MSTRGYCSTVSQSQLVRGPSVRAHSTTVSHRAARYSAGGPERDVCGGARKDVSRLRACSRSRPAGGFRRVLRGAASGGARAVQDALPRSPAAVPSRDAVFAIYRISFRTERVTPGGHTVHTHLSNRTIPEALRFLYLSNMSTQHTSTSSSRAQRVIAQLSQGRQSRI